MKEIKRASIINIIANIFLFIIKFTVGLMFNAISLLSDAINSLSDIIAAIFIYFTVRINGKKADEEHPFGHTRAENIAGYTTGLLMIILALTIGKLSIEKFISKEVLIYSNLMLFAVIATLITKSSLYFYIKSILKNHKSPALKANMQDHLNDCLIIMGVFVAIIGIKYNIYWLDPIIGFLIAIYILKEGIEISLENIQYLMGKSASKETVKKIKLTALKIKQVKGIHDLRTQYLGTEIQVEIHIELDAKISLKQSHDIGKEVKIAIENLKEVNNCFVHIDVYEN